MKRLLLGTLLGLTLTACGIDLPGGGGGYYDPIDTDSLADVQPIATAWLGRGDATAIRVAIPSFETRESLLILMSDEDTRIAASQLGVPIASSNEANVFIAGGSAYDPAGVRPSIVPDPIAPPDENLYACKGPCLALDPTEGSVTFSVRNLGPSGFIDFYAAWIGVGDVTEPDNDVRRDVPLRSTVGTSLWAAIETLGDVDWFYAVQNHDYEIITPEFLALHIRVYDGGGSTGFECDLDAGEIYGFDAFNPIDATDDVRIEARFGDAASYYGG